MKFKTLYQNRPTVSLAFSDASRTHQEFKDEADVNVVVERFLKTGSFYDRLGSVKPFFGDFSAGLDYQTALDAVNRAQQSFDALPAAVRNRFSNNPRLLLQFISDPSNRAEAVELGLVEPSAPSPQPSAPSPQPSAPSPQPAAPAAE